jgi:hypothetical protein
MEKNEDTKGFYTLVRKKVCRNLQFLEPPFAAVYFHDPRTLVQSRNKY